MEKRIEAGWLLDFYGPLITERRREVMRLYCEEDLSISEIAESAGVTRQGVHDAIRQATRQLEAFEAELGLLARFQRMEREVEDCRRHLKQIIPAPGSEPALAEAERALTLIERTTIGEDEVTVNGF